MLFRKPVIPRPLHVWFQDPLSAIRLRELVTDPVFLSACATLSALAQPTFGVSQKRTGEQRAAAFDWLSGYHDFLRDLEKLTKLPEPARHSQGLPDEWSHTSLETTPKP